MHIKMVMGRVEWAHFSLKKQNIEPIIAINHTNGYFLNQHEHFPKRKKTQIIDAYNFHLSN